MRVFVDCPICGTSLMVPKTRGYTTPVLARKAMHRHLCNRHPTFGDRDRSEIMSISSHHIHESRNGIVLLEVT